jgi:hypothetical protein
MYYLLKSYKCYLDKYEVRHSIIHINSKANVNQLYLLSTDREGTKF